NWGTEAQPDALGRVVIRAAKGLETAHFVVEPSDLWTSFSVQMAKDAPRQFVGRGFFDEVGAFNTDKTGILIRSVESPVVIVTIEPKEGMPPKGASVGWSSIEPGRFGASSRFVPQADGRFRSTNLVPDFAGDVDAISSE